MNEHVGAAEAAAILREIDAEQRRVRNDRAPDLRLLFAVWGAAWIVGYLAIALVLNDVVRLPLWGAIVVAIGAVTLAIIVSTVHSARRGRGSRGPSVVQGAIYGNTYPLAFAIVALFGWRLAEGGSSAAVVQWYWVAMPSLVVGALSIVGALLFDDRANLAIGAAILVVAVISLLVTAPANFYVAAGGGVIMLAYAIVESLRPGTLSGPLIGSVNGRA